MNSYSASVHPVEAFTQYLSLTVNISITGRDRLCLLNSRDTSPQTSKCARLRVNNRFFGSTRVPCFLDYSMSLEIRIIICI